MNYPCGPLLSGCYLPMALWLTACIVPSPRPDARTTDSVKVTMRCSQVRRAGSHVYVEPKAAPSGCNVLIVNRAGKAALLTLYAAVEAGTEVTVTGWWRDEDVFIVEAVYP